MPLTISGKNLRVQIGATTLAGAFGWTVEESFEELDGTVGESAGSDEPDVGVQSARITLELLLDITAGQYSIIRAGTTLTTLKCWLRSAATNPMFSFPTARVFSTTPRGEVKGRFQVTVQAKSVGTYTCNDPN